jgi:hypothetical protein
MKIFTTLLLASAVVASMTVEAVAQQTADQVKARIDAVLKQLPSLLTSDPTGRSAQEFFNRSRLIDYTIQGYFYGIPGALHESSPAREQRIRQVEAWLAPFEPVLISVVEATARDNEATNAVATLLAFSKPTQTLHTALLKVARDNQTDTQKAAEAYNTLFMLAIDDAEIRKEVREKIDWRDEFHTRADLAANLLHYGSSYWAMPELEDLYHSFLSMPYTPGNYPARGGRSKLQNQYDIAIRGLKAFGTLGAPFADLLKARLAEMDPVEDTDLINSCKETILMVEGKCNPKPIVNWKGIFLGVSSKAYPAWLAVRKPSATSSPSPDAAPPSLASPALGNITKEKEATPQSGDATSTPWSILVVLVVAALGLLWLLWLLSKRRSRV